MHMLSSAAVRSEHAPMTELAHRGSETSQPMLKKYILFSTLSPVTFTAQHLAIFRYGFAPFMPRCDVVGFHL